MVKKEIAKFSKDHLTQVSKLSWSFQNIYEIMKQIWNSIIIVIRIKKCGTYQISKDKEEDWIWREISVKLSGEIIYAKKVKMWRKFFVKKYPENYLEFEFHSSM